MMESTNPLVDAEEAEDLASWNLIQNKYAFFYKKNSPSQKVEGNNYLKSIQKISSFQTVERFWQIYDHLKRPNNFRTPTEFHLFKEGISPTWEDSNNSLGGKWVLKLKKGIASRYWEEIILAIIGEQFDVGAEICGAVLTVRTNDDYISVWNRTADNIEAVNKIRDQLRRILNLPSIIAIEYKRHQDSLVDRSSYRNPSVVWREPTTRSNTYHGNESSSSNDYGNNGGKPPYVNYNRSASTRGNEHRDNSYRAKGEGFSGDSAGGEKPREYSSSYTRPPRPAFSTESGAWGKRPGNKPDDTSKEKEKAPSTTAHSSTSSTNAWRNAPTASKIATGSTPSSAETETSGAAAGSVSKASTGDGKPAATGEVWSRAPKAVKQGSE